MLHRIATLLVLAGILCFAREVIAPYSTPAAWHRTLKEPAPGTLLIDDAAVEFRSPKFSHRWLYGEIKTFELSAGQELVITDYENRHWHEPGERQFRFTLPRPVPPALAAGMASRVGRPVINGDPDPGTAAIAEIPAHRRKRFGGSNGKLRFQAWGIDYVTPDGRDGRSWRWSDIQTLASPSAWEFRVGAYREIVEFDLKKPLARDLFDSLWDHLDPANLEKGNQ